MKKMILIALVGLIAGSASAQNPKYIATMEKNVLQLDTTRDAKELQTLANTFERIASAEKKEWLPSYYAAYCYVNMTYSTKGDEIDIYCDKADAYLNKADSISPNNSEIITLKSQVAGARISVNPMTRGQKYGTEAAILREKAKGIDPSNPRTYYLDGTSLFYTPAMFGGGKDKAKPAFEKALSLYETFKPASSISPRWGKRSAEYFLKQCEAK